MPTELLARSFSRTRWMPFLDDSRMDRLEPIAPPDAPPLAEELYDLETDPREIVSAVNGFSGQGD